MSIQLLGLHNVARSLCVRTPLAVVVMVATIALSFTGAALGKDAKKYRDKDTRDLPYAGPKQVVAVLPFDNRVRDIPQNWNLGGGLSEILVTELIESDRFLLVERDSLQDIVREQELGMSGLVRKETAVASGNLSGAQFMIKGAITEFNAEAGGGGLTLSFREAEAGTKSRTAYVGIDVRIVDNLTGQVHASYHATGTATSRGLSLAAAFKGADNVKIGASTFYSTALGLATREAVEKVVRFIVEESTSIPWQGSVIQTRGSSVFVNRGESANVREGDIFGVFSKGETLIDPETGFNLGSEEEYLCNITITRLMPKFSTGRKSEGCRGMEINRGDLVRVEK